jgi:hypothetical protein
MWVGGELEQLVHSFAESWQAALKAIADVIAVSAFSKQKRTRKKEWLGRSIALQLPWSIERAGVAKTG